MCCISSENSLFRWETRRGAGYDAGYQEFERGDFSRAISLWTPLARRGNAAAMYGLGVIAGEQSGDMQQAAVWMRKAANRGLAIAYTALGRMYEIGDPFTQDFRAAAQLYEDAARGGEARAQFYLGQLHERGDGVEKDVAEALRWYRKAAQVGDADALAKLRSEADFPKIF